jgi:hypothetical protein
MIRGHFYENIIVSFNLQLFERQFLWMLAIVFKITQLVHFILALDSEELEEALVPTDQQVLLLFPDQSPS